DEILSWLERCRFHAPAVLPRCPGVQCDEPADRGEPGGNGQEAELIPAGRMSGDPSVTRPDQGYAVRRGALKEKQGDDPEERRPHGQIVTQRPVRRHAATCRIRVASRQTQNETAAFLRASVSALPLKGP